MERTAKTAVTLLCILAMLLPLRAFAADVGKPDPENTPPDSSTKTTTVTYNYVTFGSYPQREIVPSAEYSGVYGKAWSTESDYIIDETLYASLIALPENNWSTAGDATIGDNQYRRIQITDATSTAADDNSYDWSSSSKYHYFLYEPIQWRVLAQNGSDYFLLSETVLDDQRYNVKMPNTTWETCTVRSWLNGYDASKNYYAIDYSTDNFIDTAFTSEEKAMIKNTTLENSDNIECGTDGGNDTTDRIFLLSEAEIYAGTAAEYGFVSDYDTNDAARQVKSSTYAKAMGTYASCDSSYLGNCDWWLRSPGAYNGLTILVRESGSVYRGGQHANSDSRGIRPAMYVSFCPASGQFQTALDTQKADIQYRVGEDGIWESAPNLTAVTIGDNPSLDDYPSCTVCVTPKSDSFYGFRIVTYDADGTGSAATYTIKNDSVSYDQNTGSYFLTIQRSENTARSFTVELLWNDALSYTVSYNNSGPRKNGQVVIERIRLGDVIYSIHESDYTVSEDDTVFPMSVLQGGCSDINDTTYTEENDCLLQYGVSCTDGSISVLRYKKGVVIDYKLIPDYGYQVNDVSVGKGSSLLQEFIPDEDEVCRFSYTPSVNRDVGFSVSFVEAADTVDLTGTTRITGASISNGGNAASAGNLSLTVSDTDTDSDIADAVSTFRITLDNVVSKTGENGNWTTDITEFADPVTITLNLNQDLYPEESYCVIREHNQEKTEIPATYDSETGALCFETNCFSAFTVIIKTSVTNFRIDGETTLGGLPANSFDAKLYVSTVPGHSVLILLAAYTSDGRFCGVQTKTATASGDVTFSIDNTGGSMNSLCAFAVDLQTFTPLTASVTLGG